MEHFDKSSELLRDIGAIKYTTDQNAVMDLQLKGWLVLMTFGPFDSGVIGTLLGQPSTEEMRRVAMLEAEAVVLREQVRAAEQDVERQRAEADELLRQTRDAADYHIAAADELLRQAQQEAEAARAEVERAQAAMTSAVERAKADAERQRVEAEEAIKQALEAADRQRSEFEREIEKVKADAAAKIAAHQPAPTEST